MPKEGRILAVLETEEKEKLKKIAAAQSRSLSSLVAFILREWLAKQEND
ncbi:hypothetical protein [Tolypothrix sp. PCC 7601]|nr:hypothetical protein [Tolypothrix sp. PCC 7601]UYD38989.1 hypothetical protein HG267_41460 [Tolypothrix sp. PCC 7601]